MMTLSAARRFLALALSSSILAQPVAAQVVRVPSLAPMGSALAAPGAAAAAGTAVLQPSISPLAAAPALAAALAPSAAAPALAVAPAAAVLPGLALALAPARPAAAAGPAAATPESAKAPALEQLRGVGAAWSKGDAGEVPASPRAAKPASAAPDAPEADKPVALKSHDFGRMFDLTRRVLSRPEARKFLKKMFKDELAVTPEEQKLYGLPDQLKDVSESQFMLLLGVNPQLWPTIEQYLAEVEKSDGSKKGVPVSVVKKWITSFSTLLKDQEIAEKFKKLNDPTHAMRLEWPDGKPGYTNQKIYTTHGRMVDGKLTPSDDLVMAVREFIQGAKKEGMFNVFDFDLMSVADELIASADRGVKWTGGIYSKNIDTRPEVKAVFDKLKAHKNITMVSVDSVGLNHQKLIVRDWNDEKLAASLLSSGNFTQSCIGPEGDLVCVPADKRDKTSAESVPNANHLVTMDGYLPAQVVANKLTQTLVYGLRGNDYPLGGAFRIFGPKPAGAADAPYIVLSFAPRGTLGDIGRDMIRRLIVETRGPLRIMVFAFSSKTVRDAIVERARLEKAEGRTFDLKIVGDTPFTMRDYSVPLALAGLMVAEKGDKKQYVESDDNGLREALGKEAYEKILPFLRIAPHAYGEHVTAGGQKFNAKLHHKVVISGLTAMLGTSFNPSDNAEHNNEQILITDDPVLLEAIGQAFEALFAQSPRSIREEAVRRNERNEVDSDSIDGDGASDDEQARGKGSKK